jgi:hypothetical protein
VPAVEFRYRQETARGEPVLRPVARVLLEHCGRAVLLLPYIDSGADVTLIPKSVGEALGFSLDQGDVQELSGVGEGRVAVAFKTVRMGIGEYSFDCRIAWALIEEVPPLLDRKDVFDRFSVLFREWESKVLLTPKDEPAGLLGSSESTA